LLDPPKLTQNGIFGLKRNHLATLCVIEIYELEVDCTNKKQTIFLVTRKFKVGGVPTVRLGCLLLKLFDRPACINALFFKFLDFYDVHYYKFAPMYFPWW
jgi:hypothetical protein